MAGPGTFFSELKRRHVYRVAVAYAIVAWVVVQAASIVVPELLLPAWITRAVIVLALLGFPLALVLAWAYDITPDGVQRTAGRADDRAGASPPAEPPAAASPAPSGQRRRPRPLVAALVALAVASGGMGAYAIGWRAEDGVPRGEALLHELSALSEAGQYERAFVLAQRASARGDEVPDTLSAKFTDRLTVVSEPAGARVVVRRYEPARTTDRAGGGVELGRTPLRGIAIARGDHHVRIEADGHAAAERIASSAQSRSLLSHAGEVLLEVRLLPAERVPDDMVYVPGGRYQIASRDLQTLSATIGDYLIDRYEVTNARYAEFVDGGGYARHEYWSDLAEIVGARADSVRRRMVDQTGLPAPRGWSAQQPLPAAALHPVSGVSWYEAAAHCRFRGARLPTLYEWEKAARDGEVAFAEGVIMPWGYVGPGAVTAARANFDGSGTVPVGTYPFGISPYGAHDMAGNVKEWLYNESESGRAVTGGSWADPIYVFSEVGSLEPASSSPTVGFRCARATDADRTTRGAGGEPLRVAVETPVYHAVDEATFRTLRSHYHYDLRALEPVIEARLESGGWIRERISYNGPTGRTLAYLFLPKTGRPPFQTMVYVPNSAALWGGQVAAQADDIAGPLVRAGRALFVVVMEGMTEREYPPGFEPPATNSVAFRDQMVRRATELRIGLDYLETRDDIDAGALAYIGASWGAGSRLVFAAVDDRFRAVVLIGAGIDERVHPTLPEASNINFAPYIRAPKLIVNGREDEEHPWLTRGLPLWNLLAEPKELALFDGVGHLPPAELRIPRIREFLDRHLGSPAR